MGDARPSFWCLYESYNFLIFSISNVSSLFYVLGTLFFILSMYFQKFSLLVIHCVLSSALKYTSLRVCVEYAMHGMLLRLHFILSIVLAGNCCHVILLSLKEILAFLYMLLILLYGKVSFNWSNPCDSLTRTITAL